MKIADLDILLQEGEGVMLEYKESLSSSFTREMVAFANTAGGKILLGVRDDGTVKGIADTNEMRARIQDIARKCDPPIKILLQHIGEVTIVTVRESDAKPVQCSDGFFLRQGEVSQKLSREEIRNLFQQTGAIRFDLSICSRFKYPNDFDKDKFNNWLQKSTISQGGTIEDILVNIEAAERSGGKLLFRNAGVLFFAREPRRFFNQAYITCLLFKGTSKVHVLDRKDFDGGVVADIEDSLRFIERNTRTAYKIEKLQREEITEYPMPALREAITNSVMHRDWFIDGANVFVEIFDDRIEISNPGGLPKGMLIEDLGTKSVRRNPLIADMLHRISYIEKAGTGIRRMRDGARDQGYPEPNFSTDGFFTAIFKPVVLELAHDEAHKVEYALELSDQVGTKLGLSRDQVRTKVGLSWDKINILTECLQGSPISKLIMNANRTNRTKFRNHVIKPLIDDGLIEMTIPDKPNSSKQSYRTTSMGCSILNNAATISEADEMDNIGHGDYTNTTQLSSNSGLSRDQVGNKSGLSQEQVKILNGCLHDISLIELIELFGRTNRTKFKNDVINPLIEADLLEFSVPEKPRSSKQRYRITEKGRMLLKENKQ